VKRLGLCSIRPLLHTAKEVYVTPTGVAGAYTLVLDFVYPVRTVSLYETTRRLWQVNVVVLP
jgi:hypothetical protein